MGVNLRFFCPQEGCPKRGENPIFFQIPKIPANYFDKRGSIRISCAHRRPLPVVLYLQPLLTSSRRGGHCKSRRRRPSPQPPQLWAAAPRRACVHKAPPPRRRRPPPPRWPHCSRPMGCGLGGCRSAELRGRGWDPACWRHLVPAAAASGRVWWVGLVVQVLETSNSWSFPDPCSLTLILQAIHNVFFSRDVTLRKERNYYEMRSDSIAKSARSRSKALNKDSFT